MLAQELLTQYANLSVEMEELYHLKLVMTSQTITLVVILLVMGLCSGIIAQEETSIMLLSALKFVEMAF